LTLTPQKYLMEVDEKLKAMSWDETFRSIDQLVTEAMRRKHRISPAPPIQRPRRAKAYDYVIVGAGFAGSVLAERLAAGSGKRVLLCDRRNHIGGNAFDHFD